MAPRLLFSLLLLVFLPNRSSADSPTVCIIGSGIAGSSVAHFLRQYSPPSTIGTIRIFERHAVVGGRMATVTIGGETFEAGGSILHPRNYHALNFTKMLNLRIKGNSSSSDDDSFSLGIWDGHKFLFKTFDSKSKFPFVRKFFEFINSVRMFFRYGISLLRMTNFVEATVNKFCKYYESFESRPVFLRVEDMLKWSGLYDLTTQTLEEELVDQKLSPRLIDELVTVITRINYGQSVHISGLAGAVSLAGSGGDLWAVEGGNWQMAAGLINRSDVTLHLHEEIGSITNLGEFYQLNSTKGNSYACEVTVVATPLDELSIRFTPAVSVPERKLQHTYTTFIRGLLNPERSSNDSFYKLFSRQPMTDELLDQIFSLRSETIRINWGAYPHYHAPETFAPFILDDLHLYYVNAFENAASTMETSAVSAENMARLILSRLSERPNLSLFDSKISTSDPHDQHSEL